jgi:hypothetical protein
MASVIRGIDATLAALPSVSDTNHRSTPATPRAASHATAAGRRGAVAVVMIASAVTATPVAIAAASPRAIASWPPGARVIASYATASWVWIDTWMSSQPASTSRAAFAPTPSTRPLVCTLTPR